MGELLVALAEEPAAPTEPAELAEIRGELAALRRELAATSRSAPDAATSPAELAEIRGELAALRRDLMFVSSLDPSAAAGAPSAELAELRQEIASMRQEMARFMRQNTLGVVAPPRGQPARPARDLPGTSAPMRPVEELLDEVPQIEGEVPPEQLKAYAQRQRVRPEDITLTREDIQRQERRSLSDLAASEMRQKLGPQSRQSNQANNTAGVILLIAFALMTLLMCWAMLAA